MSAIDPRLAMNLNAALAAGPDRLIALLAELFTGIAGVRTMTILATAPDRSIVHRIATSDPEHFPIGGSDPIDSGAWSRRIFGDKRPIVANNPAEMQAYIPETADLVALGYGATLCVPVIIAGEVRGTINLLGDAEIFTADTLAAVDTLLPLAALIFTFEGISAP
jgi:GAF domain-containing protein